ncbi:MAG: CPBP family glutamic-type intramembrane protease [Terriglobales bacterium]
MATTTATSFPLAAAQHGSSFRNLAELILGFAGILLVLWLPTRQQLILGPIALLAPLAIVLSKRPGLDELGLGLRGLVSSLWILPAAVGVTVVGVLVARELRTFHALYNADFRHVGGYVLWTIYQQFLLQDYFMPRLSRVLTSDAAVAAAALLFAVAHLPNLSLTLATLVWGAVSCALFRRYRNLYILGLSQGLLGLGFAVCVPDALHHHLRVGLGYFHYRPMR